MRLLFKFSCLREVYQSAVCLITLAANDESVHVVGVVIPFSTPLPFNSLAFAD